MRRGYVSPPKHVTAISEKVPAPRLREALVEGSTRQSHLNGAYSNITNTEKCHKVRNLENTKQPMQDAKIRKSENYTLYLLRLFVL